MMPADPHRHLDDETLNAVLDGEATEEERAYASACPDCSARLVRLGSVATALGAPVAPSEVPRRRAAVNAALAAQDPGVAAPTPLHSRRRGGVWRGWAAAAAVVLAGTLAVPLVENLGGSDDSQETATADRTADRTEEHAAEAGDSTTGDGPTADEDDEAAFLDGSTAPGAYRTRPHLGAIDLTGLDELAASIEGDLQARRTAAEEAGSEHPCEQATRRRDPSLQRLAYVSEGTVAGRPAVVLAFEVTPPGTPPTVRLLVLATDDCTQLAASQ